MRRLAAVAVVALLVAVGCGGSDGSAPAAGESAESSPTSPAQLDRALRDELMAMSWRDQAGRTGGVDNEGDAVRTGEPQTYGTQIGCVRGRAKLATPLTEPERVDELRAEVGLEPLDAYLAEVDEICAKDSNGR
jgi:hypothetical protein